jgi:YesN/AraC family two-component response regulator
MPGMNGSEMVNKIMQIRPELKVLFMSGYTAEIVAQRGIVDEGMHYIQKPLDMKRLSEKILEVLAQR